MAGFPYYYIDIIFSVIVPLLNEESKLIDEKANTKLEKNI
jgi:hypothetical protein